MAVLPVCSALISTRPAGPSGPPDSPWTRRSGPPGAQIMELANYFQTQISGNAVLQFQWPWQPGPGFLRALFGASAIFPEIPCVPLDTPNFRYYTKLRNTPFFMLFEVIFRMTDFMKLALSPVYPPYVERAPGRI